MTLVAELTDQQVPRARRATLNRTSGGSSETELNELMVSPIASSPGPLAVITATPVANCDSARRKAPVSMVMKRPAPRRPEQRRPADWPWRRCGIKRPPRP